MTARIIDGKVIAAELRARVGECGAEPLLATLRDGDLVMIKGSNGSRAGLIAAALREAAAGGKDG